MHENGGGKMTSKHQNKIDLNNKARRVPICFCIDTSSSMGIIVDGFDTIKETGNKIYTDQVECQEVNGGITLMDKVHEAIENFYSAILDDDISSDSCEIAIVTFNDTPSVFDGFSSVEEKKKPKFYPVPKSNTNISSAISLSLEVIEERKREYEKNKISYYKPWLVIFSDGHSSDDVSLIKKELSRLEDENLLYVCTVLLTDSEGVVNSLKGFSKGEPIKCREPNEIKGFFDFLSRSIYFEITGGKTDYSFDLDF